MKIINATSEESLEQSLAGLTIITADVRCDAVTIFAKSCEDGRQPRVIILTTKKNFHQFFDPKYPDDVKKVYAYKFSELVRYFKLYTIKETIIYDNEVHIYCHPPYYTLTDCYTSTEVVCIVSFYSTYLGVDDARPDLTA